MEFEGLLGWFSGIGTITVFVILYRPRTSRWGCFLFLDQSTNQTLLDVKRSLDVADFGKSIDKNR